MRKLSRTLAICAAAMLSPLLSGCTLLLAGFGDVWNGPDEDARTTTAAKVTAQSAPALELWFIERRAGDPHIGESLWTGLDQIATVPAESRERLRKNGFRFGICRNPPEALQTLMSEELDGPPGRRTLRQFYQTPSGVTHQFPCAVMPEPASVHVVSGEREQDREYRQGRCVIRCEVNQTQEGWARLQILPQIHHGDSRMRPMATDFDWDLAAGQAIDSLYGQQFALELNQGESLVLGGCGDDPRSPGSFFFHSDQNGEPVERLLVIRLKSIEKVVPVRTGR